MALSRMAVVSLPAWMLELIQVMRALEIKGSISPQREPPQMTCKRWKDYLDGSCGSFDSAFMKRDRKYTFRMLSNSRGSRTGVLVPCVST